MGKGRAASTQSQLAPRCAENPSLARPISVRHVAMTETALLAPSSLSRDAGAALRARLWNVTSFSTKVAALSVRKPAAGRRIVVGTVVASAVVHCPSPAATRFLPAIGIPIFARCPAARGCVVGTTRASCYAILAIARRASRPLSPT